MQNTNFVYSKFFSAIFCIWVSRKIWCRRWLANLWSYCGVQTSGKQVVDMVKAVDWTFWSQNLVGTALLNSMNKTYEIILADIVKTTFFYQPILFYKLNCVDFKMV